MALQSFVLCLVVRAVIRRLFINPDIAFPVIRIFRTSSDELIFECRSPKDQLNVLRYVKDTVHEALYCLEDYSQIEAFLLHKFDITPSMKRPAEMPRNVEMQETEPDHQFPRVNMMEEVIEEQWSSIHETEVEKRNPDVFFVRQMTDGQRRFTIETLPCELLTEAISIVAEHFHLCEKLPEKQPPKETEEKPKDPQPEKNSKKGKKKQGATEVGSKGGVNVFDLLSDDE